VAPNLTQIGKDFGFTTKERDQKLGGEISFAFFLMGGPVSLLVGYLTDLIPRKPLFVMLILLGEVPALLTIFVKEFWYFPALSLLPDRILGITLSLDSALRCHSFPSQSPSYHSLDFKSLQSTL
jgi:MFS family permease